MDKPSSSRLCRGDLVGYLAYKHGGKPTYRLMSILQVYQNSQNSSCQYDLGYPFIPLLKNTKKYQFVDREHLISHDNFLLRQKRQGIAGRTFKVGDFVKYDRTSQPYEIVKQLRVATDPEGFYVIKKYPVGEKLYQVHHDRLNKVSVGGKRGLISNTNEIQKDYANINDNSTTWNQYVMEKLKASIKKQKGRNTKDSA